MAMEIDSRKVHYAGTHFIITICVLIINCKCLYEMRTGTYFTILIHALTID
ncbi:hypothetical protein SAMN05661012_03957 [Chitinophaga sancti]|uniref:Uncharacterized protein n=1 Tax=Chitinophaga sancti TaxID=1004 RepID=A0A1K1RKF6_9BACT|nr:hypothetical protein SAMN05661012_03957 [Chitinophaga sancti]